MSAHVRSEQCLHAQRCVQEYVDGTLVAEEVVVVDEHLAVGPSSASSSAGRSSTNRTPVFRASRRSPTTSVTSCAGS